MPKHITGKKVYYEIAEDGYGSISFKPAIETYNQANKTHTINLINEYDNTSIWTYTETENQFIFDYDNGASVVLDLPLTIGAQTQSTGIVNEYKNGDWARKAVTATNTIKAIDATMEVSYNEQSNILYIEQQRSDLDTPVRIYFKKDEGLLYLKQGNLIYRYPMIE